MLNTLVPWNKIDEDEIREVKCCKETVDEYVEINTAILEITLLQRCACRT